MSRQKTGISISTMLIHVVSTTLCILCAVHTLCTGSLSAQRVFRLSPTFDSIDAKSVGWLPGFHGGFRQQILVAAGRLAGLRGRGIAGLWMRRDLHYRNPLQGGRIDLVIRVSSAAVLPAFASATFADNISGQPVTVFAGRVTLPNSPALPPRGGQPWSSRNSLRVNFASPFNYVGGPICIDIEGRPVAGSEPRFWIADFESDTVRGDVTSFGASCSTFGGPARDPAFAEKYGLKIGSTMRLIAMGRPGSIPLMLVGTTAIPGGLDLSAIGATGCKKFVNHVACVGLTYRPHPAGGQASVTDYQVQIPPSGALLGARFYVQFADLEAHLPRSRWTNRAGLTTSNALAIRISSAWPHLGMSIITSAVVGPRTPMPVHGEVDVTRTPVLRLLY